MKRAIILDDEQGAINVLQNHLNEFDFIHVIDTYLKMEDAEKGIIQYKPDLLFLDIRIKGQYVFTLLENLKKRNFNFAIIFVSGYIKEHIEEIIDSYGFSNFTFGYINKPVDVTDLEKKLEQYKTHAENFPQINNSKNSIIIKNTKQEYLRIRFDDIIYCHADDGMVDIYYEEDGKVKYQPEKTTLKNLEKMLSPKEFYRMSSATIIRADCFHQIIPKEGKPYCRLKHQKIGILEEAHDQIIPEGKWASFKNRFW